MSLFLPTRRLAALTALLAPVWLTSSTSTGATVAIGVTVILIFTVLYDALTMPGKPDLEVQLVLPLSVGIGDLVVGEFRVRSHWPRSIRLRLHADLPRALEHVAGGQELSPSVLRGSAVEGRSVTIEPLGETLFPFSALGRTRGEVPVGPAALRVIGTLGLVQRTFVYPPSKLGAMSITVTPSLTGVRRFRLLTVQHRLRDAGVRAIRRRGEGTSFANLREYVRGDDPRHIDWKASARRHKLISREYTAEQGQTVVIAVDAGRLMTQLADPYSRFDYALSSALVLADIAIASGDFVGLLVFDDTIRAWVPPARGAAALKRVHDALIPLQATLVEPDYALAFRTLATRHRKRSLIVIYTDVVDTRASHAIIAHTARSTARHLPVVVALRNDRLAAAAVPTARHATSALFESAAAEELISAREEALARMRQSGVSVLDVSPHQLTASVINRYLEVKARAVL
ncbi:MAG: DUF58 domain-containing protein [Gemmatimonadaceae bacterium]